MIKKTNPQSPRPPRQNRFTIAVEKIVYPGASLGHRDGKVVLCDEGLPGEVIEVQPQREKKNYIAARTTAVLIPAPQRRQPRCDHFRSCGSYQYIAYEEQCRLKKNQLTEWLSHTLASVPDITCRPAASPWNYRNKVHCQLIPWRGMRRPAYHRVGTHNQFVTFTDCALLHPAINRCWPLIESLADRLATAPVTELTIRYSYARDRLLIALHSPTRNPGRLAAVARDLHRALNPGGIVGILPGGTIVALTGDSFLEETVLNAVLCFGATSFFQIHIPLLQQLGADLQDVLALSGNERIVDVYSGVGTFGIILAPYVSQVALIESDRHAAGYIRRNIRSNRLKHVNQLPGQAQQALVPALQQRPDIVIVDPPRCGLEKSLCQTLAENPAPRLVYISCDPATLMRDLRVLSRGYQVRHLFWYDFFAHTPHWETMAVLTKSSAGR